MSALHTTMHLKTGVSLQNYPQLWWTAYEGVAVESYIIYLENVQTKLFDSIGSTFLTSFTDLKPNGTNNYRVAIKFAKPVAPSRLKTDTGPFSQSFSNMSEASLVAEPNANVSSDITIFPNPAQSSIFVRTPTTANCKLYIVDLLGQVVAQQTGSGQQEINCQQLTNGMYWMQIELEGITTTKQFIIKK